MSPTSLPGRGRQGDPGREGPTFRPSEERRSIISTYEPPDSFSRWTLYIAMMELSLHLAQVLNGQ